MEGAHLGARPIAVASAVLALVLASASITFAGDHDRAPIPAARPHRARARCDHPGLPRPHADPGYRVVVSSHHNRDIRFPSPQTSWRLEYVFDVPPLPCSPAWSSENRVMYVWGDVDFDAYGPHGRHPLTTYRVNQIVPQVMVGYGVSHDDPAYAISSTPFPTWTMQAQYFWGNGPGHSHVQTGPLVSVNVGETVTTRIRYRAATGTITATIGSRRGTSAITIRRPFPNERHPPFASWRDFFEQAAALSGGLLGRPVLNVETHYVDRQTVCGTLPFRIRKVVVPGASHADQLDTMATGGLRCPGTRLADVFSAGGPTSR